MQCREVNRRLNEKFELSDELKEHIKQCHNCQRELQLAGMLDAVFISERESRPYETSSFDEIKALVVAQSSLESAKEISLMAKLKGEIEKHPGFSFGIAFTSAIIAVMLLIPASFNQTVGYDLAFKGFQTASVIPQERMMNLLETFGYGNARVNIKQTENGYDYEIANLPSREAAMTVEYALTELSGVRQRAEIKPVVRRVSGNLYAQVKEKVKARIITKDKTTEQIKVELKLRLQELGVKGGIDISIDEQGSPIITLTARDSTEDNTMNGIIWLDMDESGNIDLGLIDGCQDAILIDTKGKTADQVKQEIIQKIVAKGQEAPEIEVIRPENGFTKIKIKKSEDE